MDRTVERAKIKHGLVVAILGEIRFRRDERFQRAGDALIDQNGLTVQALQGHVGQIACNGLAKDGVGAVFIFLIGRAEHDLDVRVLGLPKRHDAFEGHIEQGRIGVADLDRDILGRGCCCGQTQGHCGGGKFHDKTSFTLL